MKLNKKGFMLAEVVVVSVVIATVLVTAFTALSRLSSAYETRNRYYDIDAAYMAIQANDIIVKDSNVNNFVKEDKLLDLCKEEREIEDYLKQTFDKKTNTLINFYFSPYKKTKLVSTSITTNSKQTFKDYLSYLSNNLNFDEKYTYLIITERCNIVDNVVDENDCYYYALKVR